MRMPWHATIAKPRPVESAERVRSEIRPTGSRRGPMPKFRESNEAGASGRRLPPGAAPRRAARLRAGARRELERDRVRARAGSSRLIDRARVCAERRIGARWMRRLCTRTYDAARAHIDAAISSTQAWQGVLSNDLCASAIPCSMAPAPPATKQSKAKQSKAKRGVAWQVCNKGILESSFSPLQNPQNPSICETNARFLPHIPRVNRSVPRMRLAAARNTSTAPVDPHHSDPQHPPQQALRNGSQTQTTMTRTRPQINP
jgi:hypothetical protein